MDTNALFVKIFGSENHNGELLLDQGERALAAFVFDVAREEVHDEDSDDDEIDGRDFDTCSVVSFEVKIEAAIENFERVIQLFKKTRKAKENFLKKFEEWSPGCKQNIELLKECAKAIQKDKFNSDISKVVSGVVGALGSIVFGISFLTPLAAVTVPLAIGGGVASALGGAVAVGTSITEFALLKTKLDEAKKLVEKEQESFSSMAHWFTYPEELRKALENLLSYSLLKGMAEDVKKCMDEARRRTDMTVGQFKCNFKKVVKSCMQKMKKDSNVNQEFGHEIAPFVMTFVFVVCLMKGQNRIILDCVMITQSIALGYNLVDIGIRAGQVFAGVAVKGAVEAGEALAKLAVMEVLVALGLVIDLLNVVLSSIDLHKRPETAVTKKINETVAKLEKLIELIENVYNEVKKCKSLSSVDVTHWTTIILNSVPEDAKPVDIGSVVKSYLAEEVKDCFKLKRLPTNGNNWLVKVPASHSQLIMLQPYLTIKDQRCEITQ